MKVNIEESIILECTFIILVKVVFRNDLVTAIYISKYPSTLRRFYNDLQICRFPCARIVLVRIYDTLTYF